MPVRKQEANRQPGGCRVTNHNQNKVEGRNTMRRNITGTVTSALALSASMLAVPMALAADPAPLQLEEIIVTANRRAENLQSVPVSIAALSADALETKGVSSAAALSGMMPNVRVNSPFSETQPNFTIRGVGVANEFNPNAQSPIGVYFDEAYQGFRASHGAALYDLERIEVLKGPQGTLYGRNTTGGAINLITRRPELGEDKGYLTAGIGNYGRFTLTGAAEATLVEDELGARIAFTRLYRDGYIKNVTERYGATNRLVGTKDFDSDDSMAGRLSIRAKPNDTIDLTLRGYLSHNEPVGSTGVIKQLNPTGADITGRVLNGIGKREAAATNQGRFVSNARGLNLKADVNIGDIAISSVTGYDTGDLHQPFDFDGSPSAIGEWRPNAANFWSVGQDLHATYDADGFSLIGGAYIGSQKVKVSNNYQYVGFLSALAGPGQFNPGGNFFPPTQVPPTAIDAHQELSQAQETYAVYAEAVIDLTDTTRLTLGGRLTHEQVKLTDYSSFLRDSSGRPFLYTYASAGAPILSGLPVLSPAPAEIKESVTKPTGRIVLSQDVGDQGMVYGSYSRGYRSGSFNGQSIVPVPNFVKPEEVDAFEAGYKGRFLDNALQVNAALFYNDYKGQQVQEIQNGVAFLRSLDGRMYGFELEATAFLSDDVRVQAALGYLNTRYKNGQFLAPGDAAATDPRGIALGGNAFPFAPEWTASLSPEMVLAQIGDGNLIVNADVQYASRQYFDPFNDRQAMGPIRDGQKGYTLVDARLRYDADNFTIALWGKNLFNKYYYSYGLNIESFAFDFFTPGAPRTYGVEATIRF